MVRRTALGRGIAGVAGIAGIAGMLYALIACSSLPDLHFDNGEGGVGREGGVVGDGGAFSCRNTTSFSCQDAVPDWTPVLFAAAGEPSCPSGTSSIDLKVAAGDASATCACSCNGAGGSCANGSFTVTSAADSACAVSPSTTTVSVDAAGCAAINGGSFSLSSHAMITPPTGPTACTATGGQAAALASGRLCQLAGEGTGCSGGQSCVPRSNGGFQSCVTKLGSSECPTGFSKRSTAGTSAVDNRACTGCTCGPATPCTGGSVSFYDSSQCKSVGNQHGAEGINDSCSALSPDSNFTATHYRSTPPNGGGCGAPTNPGTAAGRVDFQNVRTICCR